MRSLVLTRCLFMFGSLDPIQMYISEKHEEKPVEQDVDIDGDQGWIHVTSRRRNKSSLRKELSEQPVRGKMVKKSEKQKSIKRPKRAKIEVHHYQKPRRLVTLEEFLPSSLVQSLLKAMSRHHVSMWIKDKQRMCLLL